MKAIRSLRDVAKATQAELAAAAGTSQPTIAAYEAGRKSPTLRTLERLARALGFEVQIEFHPPMTREERRSLALHRAIVRHLRDDPEAVIGRARQTLARMARVAPTSPAIEEWRFLLDRPVDVLAHVMLDPSPWGRELRHTTPFAGVLSARERAEVIRGFADDWREAS